MRKLVGEHTHYRLIALISVAIIVIGIAATIVFWPDATPPKQHQIPASVRSSVSFPIYYPEEESNTWKVDPQTIRSEGNVVLFVVKTPDGDINVTQQAKDEKFDHDKFNRQVLTDGTLIIAPAGNGAIGKADDKTMGSLVADKTWIIATPASKSITQTQLIQLFNVLKTDT